MPYSQCIFILQLTCCHLLICSWAHIKPDGKYGPWAEGATSKPRPVGFYGNTEAAESYQVTHPSCEASNLDACKRIAANVTSGELLNQGTNNTHDQRRPIVVKVGKGFTCVLPQSSKVLAVNSKTTSSAHWAISHCRFIAGGLGI